MLAANVIAGPEVFGRHRGFGRGIGGGIGHGIDDRRNLVTVMASVGEKRNAEVGLSPMCCVRASCRACVSRGRFLLRPCRAGRSGHCHAAGCIRFASDMGQLRLAIPHMGAVQRRLLIAWCKRPRATSLRCAPAYALLPMLLQMGNGVTTDVFPFP